jgi:hypothetical protein
VEGPVESLQPAASSAAVRIGNRACATFEFNVVMEHLLSV